MVHTGKLLNSTVVANGRTAKAILGRETLFKLSPSDFAFLWDECKRCFWLKVRHGFPRPSAPFPKIFTLVHSYMQEAFSGIPTEELADGMPSGVIECGEKWVESSPIRFSHLGGRVYIKGRLDSLIHHTDNTFGVADFKTVEPRFEHLDKYARQLHGYAYALENPAPDAFGVSPVTCLGLLAFQPDCFLRHGEGIASLGGNLRWVEIERDEGAFLAFLEEVLRVLLEDKPPPASSSCNWCKYRNAGHRMGL